jgi:hypothetical protein|tara:strand:- start:295 stop:483 length:189 start_codon:yes stop_codon:yes gene_type:complete
MKKSFLSKFLAFFFLCSLVVPVTVSLQSCGGPKYKTRNGGKRVNSSGKVGYRKSKNRHVWGK